MNPATFSFPTTTLFGARALAELPKRLASLKIQKPLVVTDPGLLSTEAFQLLNQTLGSKKQGKNWFLYFGVHANPIEQDVQDAAEAFCADDCDGIIGTGGGSPLDVGKAARLLVRRPGFDPAQFFNAPDWSGLRPFIRIPATARTRSQLR